jgi:hypothetical protein
MGEAIAMLAPVLDSIVLIGVFLLLFYRMRLYLRTKSGKSQIELAEENLLEMRRHNDLLEKLIQSQETRIQRLESQLTK